MTDARTDVVVLRIPTSLKKLKTQPVMISPFRSSSLRRLTSRPALQALAFLATTLLVAPLAEAQASPAAAPAHWVGTWAASAQAVEPALMPPNPPGLVDSTVRQIVHVSIGGSSLRIRISDALGGFDRDGLTIDHVEIARSEGGARIDPATCHAVTFNGLGSVTFYRGELLVSDPVAFDLTAGSNLAVTFHVRDTAKWVTGHRSARCFVYVAKGDDVSAPDLPQAVKTESWYFLCGVDVLAPSSSAAIVCLGDSITDGKGSTEGENRRWPDLLAARLRADKSLADIGVLNEGIGGGAVWRGGIGETAIARLDRDVLAMPGARWLIVFEGINDLGGGKVTAGEIIRAYQQLIVQAHDRGFRVYGATITPCGRSFYASPRLEKARQVINEWIRTSHAFDAVIDFDAALRDPAHPDQLLASVDSGDHLHPNDAGARRLADAVDLSLFKP